MKTTTTSTSAAAYRAKLNTLRVNRPKTILIDDVVEAKAAYEHVADRKPSSDVKGKQQRRVKVIKEEIEIAGNHYTKTTVIPLETKRQRFMRKLNAK